MLEALQQRLSTSDSYAPQDCTKCKLCNSRKHVVNGIRKGEVDVVFVGMAPGWKDDEMGLPFQGDSGVILREALKVSGLDQYRIRLENVVRCRPPKGRTEPVSDEIFACQDFLFNAILETNPRIVVPMGDLAAKLLMGTTRGITYSRGEIQENVVGRRYIESASKTGKQTFTTEPFPWSYPMLATFHPASILHNWTNKPLLERDFRRVVDFLEGRSPAIEDTNVQVCKTVDQVRALINYLLEQDYVTWDVESTGLDTLTDQVVCIGFCAEEGSAYVVPILQQNKEEFWNGEDKEEVIAFLKSFLESDVPKGGQNIYYDISIVKHDLGIHTPKPKHDTMLLHHLIDENQPHNLDHLTKMYTTMPQQYKDEPVKYLKGGHDYWKLPNNLLWKYCGRDCDSEYRVLRKLLLQLEVEPLSVKEVYENISLPLSHPICKMQERGVAVDPEMQDTLLSWYDSEIVREEQWLFKKAGKEFNWRSYDQLAPILFGEDEFALPFPSRETSRGLPSTDKDAMKEVLGKTNDRGKQEVANNVVQLRHLGHTKSTFVTGIRNKLHTVTSRFHAHYNVAGTTSGRLSSGGPNIHNLPNPVEDEPYNVRHQFVPSPGHLFVEGDYTQIELRVAAHLSGDAFLINGFRQPPEIFDVHRMVAAEMFNVLYEEVSRWQRHIAKILNFGIIYGSGPRTMAVQANEVLLKMGAPTVSTEQMELYIAAYFQRCSGLHTWILQQQKTVRRTGKAQSLYGRVRRLTGIRFAETWDGQRVQLESRGQIQAEIDRQSVNFPIQSTAADITNIACIEIDKAIDARDWLIHLLIHLHDSLKYEVPIELIKDFILMAKEIMERPPIPDFSVPVPVDFIVSDRWDGENRIEEFISKEELTLV